MDGVIQQSRQVESKVLYLEDDEVDREAFLLMAREKGLPYEISAVATLTEARALLAQSHFDVIIADYHLPDGQSTELFDEVADTPFVLLTGTLDEELALRTLERGADDYLAKTTDQRHLEAVPFAIEKTLHRKRIREREQRLARELRESDERFRLIVEGVRDYALYMLDPDGLVATWNPGAEHLKGYAASEIVGHHFSRFYIPEDLAQGKPARELAIAIRDGQYAEEGWRVRKDGSRFWARVTITALRDAAGSLRGFAKITRDLTEPKQAEESLRGQERLLRLVLGLLPAGVWIFDAQGRMVQNNPAASVIWSSVRHEAGEDFGEYRGRWPGTGRRLSAEDWAVTRVLSKGETSVAEQIEMEGVDGTRKTILVSALPIRGREGANTGVVAVNEDITERKEYATNLEKTANQRTAKLRELVAELEHMSYSMVHDMRAPLRAVEGFVAMVEEAEQGLSAQSRSYLQKVRQAMDRMDSLVTGALNYNEAVRKELPLGPVDAAELLHDMIGSYPKFQPPAAEIRLEGVFPPVLANRSGLTQCFSQLLGNAVQFVRSGEKPQVRVWAEEKRISGLMDKSINEAGESGRTSAGPSAHESTNPPIHQSNEVVRIWFEDNGIGIPKGQEGRIFAMFQRLHRRQNAGTGIGLALVRKVTERMGGRVGVESEPGQGSRFWVELKRAP